MQTSWFWSLNAPLYLIWTERLVIIAQESTGKCGSFLEHLFCTYLSGIWNSKPSYMTQPWLLRSLTFSKDVKLARMNRGPLPWPQKGGGDRGLGRRGAAFLGEQPAAWVS